MNSNGHKTTGINTVSRGKKVPNNHTFTDPQRDEHTLRILELHHQGYSTRKIARSAGVSYSTVPRWLANALLKAKRVKRHDAAQA